jgi:ribulose-5-phosphate 4-epimerase/fuculose-1-phosphate aldolase
MVKGGKLEMVHQNSMRFQDQIAYDESYSGLIISTEEGDRLADVLGEKNIMMMGNHGVLAVGT